MTEEKIKAIIKNFHISMIENAKKEINDLNELKNSIQEEELDLIAIDSIINSYKERIEKSTSVISTM